MEYVTLREMAERLGLDRANARRWLLAAGRKLGLEPVTLRTRESGGQVNLAWSPEDAEVLLAHRTSLGFALGGNGSAGALAPAGSGVFYLVLLAPDLSARRVKAGFAESLEQRLRDHRCTAPPLEVVRTWPCRRTWEPAALACIAAVAERAFPPGEVFDVPDAAATADRLDRLFALLGPASPDPGTAPAATAEEPSGADEPGLDRLPAGR